MRERNMRAIRHGTLPVALLLLSGCGAGRSQPAPAALAQRVLEADRAFAAQAASTGFIDAAGRMFADGVIMPVPGRGFVRGRAEAIAALEANPLNRGARAEWRPMRVGISADGQQAFTFGYFRLLTPDSAVHLKYLTYWVSTPGGWRAIAFKRGRSGPVPDSAMAPALPARLVEPVSDSATIAGYRRSLADAEQAFSDMAQRAGIGNAFVANGHADAVNMGPGPQFVVGAAAIGRDMGLDSTPSPVRWSADYDVMVASSGDLGITFGMIRQNQAGGAEFPFFTIWSRAHPRERWRFIAE